jgi:signal peptidase II
MLKIEKKYNFVLFFIGLAIFDQVTKYLIRQSGGFYVCNKGVAFSLPVPWWIIYAMFLIFFLLVSLYLLEKINLKGYLINKIGLILISGGALGNLIDRLNHGCVVDFIDLNFFPVFNLADIFIFVGAMLILFKSDKK